MVIGLLGMWVGIALAAIFAPDLVTGSEHEHLAMAALMFPLFGLIGSALVSLASSGIARIGGSAGRLGSSVAGVWLIAAVIAIFAPVFVTGSDPSRIPIAVFVAPVFALVLTAWLALGEVVRVATGVRHRGSGVDERVAA